MEVEEEVEEEEVVEGEEVKVEVEEWVEIEIIIYRKPIGFKRENSFALFCFFFS